MAVVEMRVLQSRVLLVQVLRLLALCACSKLQRAVAEMKTVRILEAVAVAVVRIVVVVADYVVVAVGVVVAVVACVAVVGA